jgi:hypothetical protein
VKAFRSIAVVLLLAAVIFIGLLQIDGIAALFGGQTSFLSRIVWVLIGVAVVIAIALLTHRWNGRSSGKERGPEPGDGAVIHHSSGEADFDGLPGNVLPPIKDAERDQPYPPKRSAD